MPKLFLFTFLYLLTCSVFGQERYKFSIYAGIGSHEAIHLGIKYQYAQTRSFLFSYGNFFKMVRNEDYWNIMLEHDWILPKWEKRDELSKLSINKKLIYWQLNDNFYKFTVISFEPALARKFGFSDIGHFECDFGPVFMVVLDYKRLTFEEVGWANYVMLNASIRYNIKL